MADAYTRIFLAAAEEAAPAGQSVRLLGPCSQGFDADGYEHFRAFVAPFLDRCHDTVVALPEHHYVGQPVACVLLHCPDIVYGRGRHALWGGYCGKRAETAAYTT